MGSLYIQYRGIHQGGERRNALIENSTEWMKHVNEKGCCWVPRANGNSFEWLNLAAIMTERRDDGNRIKRRTSGLNRSRNRNQQQVTEMIIVTRKGLAEDKRTLSPLPHPAAPHMHPQAKRILSNLLWRSRSVAQEEENKRAVLLQNSPSEFELLHECETGHCRTGAHILCKLSLNNLMSCVLRNKSLFFLLIQRHSSSIYRRFVKAFSFSLVKQISVW